MVQSRHVDLQCEIGGIFLYLIERQPRLCLKPVQVNVSGRADADDDVVDAGNFDISLCTQIKRVTPKRPSGKYVCHPRPGHQRRDRLRKR